MMRSLLSFAPSAKSLNAAAESGPVALSAVKAWWSSRIRSLLPETFAKSRMMSGSATRAGDVEKLKMSLPPLPRRMSLPAPPSSTLAALLPVRLLSSELPVPLSADVPVRVSFSMDWPVRS